MNNFMNSKEKIIKRLKIMYISQKDYYEDANFIFTDNSIYK